MQPMVEEREPGVYIRSNRPDQELDFLWDRERRKHQDPDRYHLGFFAAGLFVGSIITFAGCFIWLGGPKMNPIIEAEPVVEQQVVSTKDFQDDNAVQAPVSASTVTAPQDNATTAPKAEKKSGLAISLPFFGGKKADETKTQPAASIEPKARTYEVQSGDTLGSIAIKFYDSSSPAMVEKIQHANKLTNADQLQLGQKLVIPPKSY